MKASECTTLKKGTVQRSYPKKLSYPSSDSTHPTTSSSRDPGGQEMSLGWNLQQLIRIKFLPASCSEPWRKTMVKEAWSGGRGISAKQMGNGFRLQTNSVHKYLLRAVYPASTPEVRFLEQRTFFQIDPHHLFLGLSPPVRRPPGLHVADGTASKRMRTAPQSCL